MIPRWLYLFTVLTAVAWCSQSAFTAEDGSCDLVLNADESVIRVRLTATINSRPLAAVWDDAFKALVAFFDADNNQCLSQAEASRLPSVQAIREALGIGFTPQLGKPPAWEQLDANGDGFVQTQEVARFYRTSGIGMPQVGVGTMPETARLNAALVKMLDANTDGQVSESELGAAADALEAFDRNDDELVGAGELVAGILYPGASGSVLLSHSRQDPQKKVSQIATVLTPSDRLPALPADFIASWQWTSSGAAPTLKPQPSSAEASQPITSLLHEAHSVRLIVRGDAGQLVTAANTFHRRLEGHFTDDDANHDGALETTEIDRDSANDWHSLKAALDRDSNQQISRQELDGWLQLQTKLIAGQILVTLLDGERGLFELLDDNHDGALARRELAAAISKIHAANCLENGSLNLALLPRNIMLVASQGFPRSPLGEAERSGPGWFQAMDRNADGEVSRREFRGPADAFRRLDANRDQVLSAIESAMKVQ